ncbi:MAG: hypothetical protein NTU81_02985 [Candidatus Nomurabacteria bacterium]|nr:hypothetical protein [Candidatus Nomurabacteria bacterium]
MKNLLSLVGFFLIATSGIFTVLKNVPGFAQSHYSILFKIFDWVPLILGVFVIFYIEREKRFTVKTILILSIVYTAAYFLTSMATIK